MTSTNVGLALLIGALALLVTSQCVVAYDTPAFTGMWSADMTLATVQTNPITSFRSRLDAAAILGPVVLAARSEFDQDGWLWQSFQSVANVEFFTLQCDLLYIPDPWTFAYGSGFAKIDFDSFWTTYHVGFLGSVFEGEVWRGSVLEFGTSVGWMEAVVYAYFGASLDGNLFTQTPAYIACEAGDCIAPAWDERYYPVIPVQTGSLVFTGAEFAVSSYLCHDVTLGATTMFSPSGFEYQEFSTLIWSIGSVPINLDVLLRFEMQSKSLSVAPKMGVGNRTCHGRLLVELISTGPIGLIEGFSIYGLDLFLETAGFAFRSLSVFDSVNYSLYQSSDGYSLWDAIWIDDRDVGGTCGRAGEQLGDYWEVIGIAAYRGDPCCRTLSFVALSYFGESTALFDWMRSDFRVQMQVMDGLLMRSRVVLDSEGVSEWTLGISIAW